MPFSSQAVCSPNRVSYHLCSISSSRRSSSSGPFKESACHDGDGLGAVFAEVFARLAHGQAAGSDEVQDEIAERGQRAGAGADSTAIFFHRHVADVVQLVFDAPVGARETQEPLWPCLGCGQARDNVGDLGADLVADAALPLDACDLGGARPFEVRDDLGADRDPARLDAAVALLDGSGGGQIRWRSGGGFAACLRGGKDRRNSRRCWLSAQAGCLSPRTRSRLFRP